MPGPEARAKPRPPAHMHPEATPLHAVLGEFRAQWPASSSRGRCCADTGRLNTYLLLGGHFPSKNTSGTASHSLTTHHCQRDEPHLDKAPVHQHATQDLGLRASRLDVL